MRLAVHRAVPLLPTLAGAPTDARARALPTPQTARATPSIDWIRDRPSSAQLHSAPPGKATISKGIPSKRKAQRARNERAGQKFQRKSRQATELKFRLMQSNRPLKYNRQSAPSEALIFARFCHRHRARRGPRCNRVVIALVRAKSNALFFARANIKLRSFVARGFVFHRGFVTLGHVGVEQILRQAQ